jgi:large subunit ribosomal protein L17
LGRKTAPRKALIRNLVSQVILHEKITTTLPKAKEVRPVLEKLITRAKVDSVANRRQVARFLSNKDRALEKLFVELGPLYKNRNGGYLRIIKMGNRNGDNAEMAQIQLLDTEKLTKAELEKKKKPVREDSSDEKKALSKNPTVKAKTANKKAKVSQAKSKAKS